MRTIRPSAQPRRAPWFLVLLVAACSRAPGAIPPQPIETYQLRQSAHDVRAALLPVLTAAAAQAIFRGGEELLANGIIPVQVIIENGSREAVRAAPGSFRLVRERSDVQAISATEAYGMVRCRVGLWGVFGPIGGVVPGLQDKGLQDDLEVRALKDTTIPIGRSRTGFIYFVLRLGERDLAGSHVIFTLQDAGGSDLAFDIPIEGRMDIAPPSATSTQPSAPATPAPPAPTQPGDPTVIHGTGGGVIIRSPSP